MRNIALYSVSKRQIDSEDFVIFCGLLRKHELQLGWNKKGFGLTLRD